MACTSWCSDRYLVKWSRSPVTMFTTPPGKSDVSKIWNTQEGFQLKQDKSVPAAFFPFFLLSFFPSFLHTYLPTFLPIARLSVCLSVWFASILRSQELCVWTPLAFAFVLLVNNARVRLNTCVGCENRFCLHFRYYVWTSLAFPFAILHVKIGCVYICVADVWTSFARYLRTSFPYEWASRLHLRYV